MPESPLAEQKKLLRRELPYEPAPRSNNPAHPRPATRDPRPSTLDQPTLESTLCTSCLFSTGFAVHFSNVPITFQSDCSRCCCLGRRPQVLASIPAPCAPRPTRTIPPYIPDVVRRVKLVCATPAPLLSICAYANKVKTVEDTVVAVLITVHREVRGEEDFC